MKRLSLIFALLISQPLWSAWTHINSDAPQEKAKIFCRVWTATPNNDDYRVFDIRSESEWVALPKRGMLIVWEDRRLRGLTPLYWMGSDYYVLEEGEVYAFSGRDLHQYLTRPRGLKNVKLGTTVRDSVWKAAHDEAVKYAEAQAKRK